MLTRIAGNNNTAYKKADLTESVNKAKGFKVVGNAQVAAALIFFNGVGIDNNYNLGIVLKLQKHFYLCIGLKAGQNTGSVKIVKKLTAEFKIKLVTKAVYPVADFL